MVLLGILGIGLIYGGYYVGRGVAGLSSIDRDEQLSPTDYEGRPEPAVPSPTGEGESPGNAPINFVLMGSDSRGEGEGGRSDSLMVAHVSGDRRHVYLVSFPRDMWVDIPGHGKGKINWAYSFGGPQLTVRTLEQLTGVRMDHTVMIDFEGFINLTNAIGGVDVYNPWPSQSGQGLKFEEGIIHLEGERALHYVRERYQLPNGDLDRAHRQRTVLKAIIRKIMTPETLLNPVTFTDTVGRIADTMTVDARMTNEYVVGLAMSMRITSSDSIRLLQAPIKGFAKVDGQAIDVVDEEGVAELSTALGQDGMEGYYVQHQSDTPDQLGQVEPPE